MTPDIHSKEYKGRVQLLWDVGFLNDHLIWENRIHTEGTEAKLQTVGWEFAIRAPLTGYFDVVYSHHSQHTMDRLQPTLKGERKPEQYPLQDWAGIRINFVPQR